MKYKDVKLNQIKEQFDSELTRSDTASLAKKYLGKDSELNTLLRGLGKLDKEQRAIAGKELNILKQYITEKLEQVESSQLDQPSSVARVDPTAPFDLNTPREKRPHFGGKPGAQHPLTKELEYILDIFYRMGFNVEECRQIDNDYNMFEALNFPIGHPARDNWDTFWTDENLIPPAHTSTMQNRILKGYKPPIRVVVPGRSFRNEATDPSHEHTLHQIEGVCVDEGITLGDMIGTIQAYLEGFFGQKLKVKVQPAFFPFTEPDLEYLIGCPFCKQTGCKTCGYSGWMEVMGCGMIHPNVLREAGVDAEKYTGFAWGFGLDRLVMLKNGIEDIRWLHEADLRFVSQF